MTRIAIGELTQSKLKGKAFTKKFQEALSPKGIDKTKVGKVRKSK